MTGESGNERQKWILFAMYNVVSIITIIIIKVFD